MKPKNFPARRLRRQIEAEARQKRLETGAWPARVSDDDVAMISARSVRTKKDRTKQA